MSGRRVRNVILLAIVAGIGYWIYKDRPTISGLIDQITNPLMGSRAAVKSSERNRVNTDASTTLAEQTDSRVDALREGMSKDDVRELLGSPEATVVMKNGLEEARWTYRRSRRVVVFRGSRVVSISILEADAAAP